MSLCQGERRCTVGNRVLLRFVSPEEKPLPIRISPFKPRAYGIGVAFQMVSAISFFLRLSKLLNGVISL